MVISFKHFLAGLAFSLLHLQGSAVHRALATHSFLVKLQVVAKLY